MVLCIRSFEYLRATKRVKTKNTKSQTQLYAKKGPKRVDLVFAFRNLSGIEPLLIAREI